MKFYTFACVAMIKKNVPSEYYFNDCEALKSTISVQLTDFLHVISWEGSEHACSS